MAPANKPQGAARKRTRKRKRRVASSSSSSSSSSDSDSDSSANQVAVKQPPVRVQPLPESSSDESSSSESDSESDSDSNSSTKPTTVPAKGAAVSVPQLARARSRSPTPPLPAAIPTFLPTGDDSSQQEHELRARFRKFWMASVADAFKSDLGEIRKEPGMTTSRLGILIDSLASGADVFTASSNPTTGEGVNEMEVVLDTHRPT